MTTARARMTELSGLSGVSARAHFLAITQGTGTGVDRIIFASRMTVSIEAPQIAHLQRDPTRAETIRPETTDATKRDRPNRVYALTRTPRIDVATCGAEIHVVQRTESARFVRTLPNTVATSRKRKTAVI